jgi:hypothetical protein
MPTDMTRRRFVFQILDVIGVQRCVYYPGGLPVLAKMSLRRGR